MNNTITILYVDDEPLNLKLFELNFNKKYRVITAESGDEALRILENESAISYVISDMRMPGLDGIEFTTLAKKRFPEIVFFILTGYDITEEIIKALEENIIFRYFRKPFNKDLIEKAFWEAQN